jgi:UDP-N-acetylmuramyl pentapeptide phosphotransferase/UDP-N-acetylglucosamine-1-phosphate transferase
VVNVCVDTDAGCTFKISTLYSGGVVVVVTLCCCLLLWLLGTDAVNACYGSNGVCVCVCVCVFVVYALIVPQQSTGGGATTPRPATVCVFVLDL